MTQAELWQLFNTDISALADTDKILVKTASGSNASLILASQMRAYLIAGITINSSGYWVINGTATTTKAAGDNLKVQYNASEGVQVSVDGGTTWTTVAPISVIRPDYASMTEAQRAALKMSYSDLTTAEITELQKPATDAATALENMSSSYADGILTLNINF